MALTIDRLKKVDIPLNASNKPNNLYTAITGIQLYNDSVNLYEAIKLMLGESDFVTNLGNTLYSNSVTITSSTGTSTTIPAATTSLSGVMSAADKVNLENLIVLSGVNGGALNLGTFTGSVIPDNSNIKQALQALESNLGGNGIYGGSGDVPSSTVATTLGNFTIDTTGATGRQIRLGGITGTQDNRYGININHNQVTLGNVYGPINNQAVLTLNSFGFNMTYAGAYGFTTYTNGESVYSYGGNGITFTRISGSSTLKYAADYSADFVDRSLVDKAYVDSLITSNVTNHNTLTGIQGGISTERYHLTASVYNLLNTVAANKLVGRSSGTGTIEHINIANSLTLSGTNIQLVNDLATPGNNKYYGTNNSGAKGWHSLSTSGTVTSLSGVLGPDIQITITDPTSTPIIEGVLTDTGVTADIYGNAANIPVIQVDAKGRIVFAATTPIEIYSTNIADIQEAVQDIISTTLVAGSGITLNYNDASNILTITSVSSYTDENAQDAVGSILLNTSDIEFIYNDSWPKITATLAPTGVSAGTYGSSSQTLQVQTDIAGRIYSINAFPISVNSTQVSDFSEAVDDRVANLLQAGTNITLSYNDISGTLTINSTGGGGGTFTGYTTIQEEGATLASRTVLNFIGSGITASDNTGATRTDVSLSGELNAIASLSSTGILTRTAANTYVPRTLTQSTDILISNANGVAGNPTFSLSDTGVSAGTWGTSNTIPQITIDAKGRITAATAVGVNASPNRYYLEGTTGTTFNTTSTGVFKDKDGNNATFIFNSSTKVGVFKNGLKLGESGTSTTRDYTATAPSTITFTTSLLTTDSIIVEQYA